MSDQQPNYDRIARDAIYESYRQNSAFISFASRVAEEARKAGMDEQEFRRGLEDLYEAYSSFLSGVNMRGEPRELKPWHNHFSKARLSKPTGEPFVSPDVIRGAVGSYLNGSMRVPQMDRGLLDCLIAQELFAFIDHSAGRSTFVMWTLGAAALWAFAALGGGSLGSFDWDRTKVAVVGFFGLYFAYWAFPLKGPYALYRQMKHTYQIMSGSVVSLAELRRRVTRAADRGVVWPAELYPLLDDIEKRVTVL